MAPPKILTFLYGSYMNPDVLAKFDLHPDTLEVASVSGFDITIGPLANLVRSDRHVVYGVLAGATHEELSRLYDQAGHVLGGVVYLPEAVLCQTTSGAFVPALTYITHDLESSPASADYVERIAIPARAHGFPAWYVQRIEAFGR